MNPEPMAEFQQRILLVCKGGRWNRSPRTGTGEYSGLEVGRIRD